MFTKFCQISVFFKTLFKLKAFPKIIAKRILKGFTNFKIIGLIDLISNSPCTYKFCESPIKLMQTKIY